MQEYIGPIQEEVNMWVIRLPRGAYRDLVLFQNAEFYGNADRRKKIRMMTEVKRII